MSKINEAVQQAVKNAENLKQGNTTVKVTEKVDRQVISVFLHGSRIAEFIQYYTEGMEAQQKSKYPSGLKFATGY